MNGSARALPGIDNDIDIGVGIGRFVCLCLLGAATLAARTDVRLTSARPLPASLVVLLRTNGSSSKAARRRVVVVVG